MLKTPRLILRPALLEDAHSLLKLNSDPEVMRYTGDNLSLNLLDAKELIKERLIPQFENHRMGRFSTFLKDGTYIGWCGLKQFPDSDEVDLGYRFMKKFWGQGYATESSQAALQYGFKILNLKRIIAKAMPDNVASIKVLQKLGMTFRGLEQGPCNGSHHSYVLYDITNEEFMKCND